MPLLLLVLTTRSSISSSTRVKDNNYHQKKNKESKRVHRYIVVLLPLLQCTQAHTNTPIFAKPSKWNKGNRPKPPSDLL